jgi:hypothetical protein
MLKILKQDYINNGKILLVSMIDTRSDPNSLTKHNKVRSFALKGKALKKYLRNRSILKQLQGV